MPRITDDVEAVARMVDAIAVRVLEDGDYDETAALRDLDALREALTGKPCQPIPAADVPVTTD